MQGAPGACRPSARLTKTRAALVPLAALGAATATPRGRRRHLQRIQPPCDRIEGVRDQVSERIAARIRGRGANATEEQLVAAEVHMVHVMLQDCGRLPARCPDPVALADAMTSVSDIVAAQSDFQTLQMIRRHPELLDLEPATLASRTLQLKLLLPQADVSALIWQRPTLLLLPDLRGAIQPALQKMHALMPGIRFERRLHEGGTVFWSFVSLLPDPRAQQARADHGADAAVQE